MKILKSNQKNFKLILNLIGNQCHSIIRGGMWLNLRSLKISRAQAFCTRFPVAYLVRNQAEYNKLLQ